MCSLFWSSTQMCQRNEFPCTRSFHTNSGQIESFTCKTVRVSGDAVTSSASAGKLSSTLRTCAPCEG